MSKSQVTVDGIPKSKTHPHRLPYVCLRVNHSAPRTTLVWVKKRALTCLLYPPLLSLFNCPQPLQLWPFKGPGSHCAGGLLHLASQRLLPSSLSVRPQLYTLQGRNAFSFSLKTSVFWDIDVEHRIESVTRRRQNYAQVWSFMSVCSQSPALNTLGLSTQSHSSSFMSCLQPSSLLLTHSLLPLPSFLNPKEIFFPLYFLSPSGLLVMAERLTQGKSIRSAFPSCPSWTCANDFSFLELGNSYELERVCQYNTPLFPSSTELSFVLCWKANISPPDFHF